ncbi:MAG: alpha/beta hydrolase [Clostridia bacterium]|nr:alpha/beta hydrolase [Clostridia bacterium]
MKDTRFCIMDDGIRLHARLAAPDGATGVVIIFHGFTGHMEERQLVSVAQALNGMGLATLRVDLYGHGESDGRFRDHTLFKWMSNALAVIDHARSLDFAKDIYLCGHSQGGLLAMLAAAMERDIVKGLILLAPAAMIPDNCRSGELADARFDPEHIPDSVRCWDTELGGNYFRVAQTIRVDDAIRRYDGPVLVVHGDADEAVPVQVGIDTAGGYRQGELVRIPEAGHCFVRHLDLAVEAVKAWMARHAAASEQRGIPG